VLDLLSGKTVSETHRHIELPVGLAARRRL